MASTATKLSTQDASSIEVSAKHRSAFLAQADLPWIPWVMEDTWFKLLSVGAPNGGFTMMLKVAPDNVAPIHGHTGAVEGIILEGGFAYDDDIGRTGDYVYEAAGINHKPRTGSDGLVMFAIAYGPLLGYNEDGSVAAVIDGKTMYELAEAAGQAGHVEKPSHW